MSKKIIFIFTFLFLFSFISSVYAADLAQTIDNSGQNIDKVVGVFDNPQQANNFLRKQFLSTAWFGENGILENSSVIGPLYKGYKTNVMPYTDPAIGFLVGAVPEFSWFFILAFAIWVTLIIFCFRIYTTLRDSVEDSPVPIFIIFFLVMIILLAIGVFQFISVKLADLIVSAIALTQTWYFQLTLVVLVITGFFLASYFSKYLKKFAKFKKAANKVKKMEKAVEKIGKAGEKVTKALEVMSDGRDQRSTADEL